MGLPSLFWGCDCTPQTPRERRPRCADSLYPLGTMKRALVVEDDPDIVELIDPLPDGRGVRRSNRLADGRRALERLRAESYGLLILDLQLPGLDGLSRVHGAAARQAHERRCRS